MRPGRGEWLARMPATGIVLLLASTLTPEVLPAQTPDSSSFFRKAVTVSGEMGVYGELYSMNGQPARRPSSSGRLFLRPTFTLFGLFDVPIDILISSEGSSARQSINRFGLNPGWGWGTAHLGDFTESLTDLTVSGIQIRGGGVVLNPGMLRFALLGGLTSRAVTGGAENGAYDRSLWAARLGVGRESGSYFDLMVLRAKDEISSQTQASQGITVITPNGNDLVVLGSLQAIRWSGANAGPTVRVELSRDGGATFEVLFPDAPNTGYVEWTVTGAVTSLAVVRITSTSDPGMQDASDFPFVISAGGLPQDGGIPVDVASTFATAPEENLVAGAATKVNMMGRELSFDFEADGSLFTRDLRSPDMPSDSSGLPSFVKSIYRQRTSTDADYAYKGAVALNLPDVNMRIGYRRIGPGYTSLGLASLINDLGEFSGQVSWHVSRYSVAFGYTRSGDNLLGQKTFTTVRSMYTGAISGQLTPSWNGMLSFMYLGMGNDAPPGADAVDFTTTGISTSQDFQISKADLFRTFMIGYSYQNSGTSLSQSGRTTTDVHNVNGSVQLGFSPTWDARLSLGAVLSNTSGGTSTTTQLYSASVTNRALENRLTSSLSLNLSLYEQDQSVRTILSTGYAFTERDQLGAVVSFGSFSSAARQGADFQETIASVTLSHRF